ncbi:uncharacterized protein AMSG_12216 [Thecamonas trahens ATCC 50062]|uniref:Uncharacterized protein n=1 Tax=Thecamonas trahens ATCC 50062 TaxID=461836 RepID=A0A0L0DM69_THETB|nr:hypothetical protein AMSG_12216 [Thecamonas trahens ATCC 50062]KNC53419.1 hypothetical protein AMSG_12216 [Thecamonas trahens ATCC 50062]|eukprot:XP_013754492.1 hypothetical protein AMSG_12216 [Thecamonas trahens ATCC 50062]
MSYPQLAHVLRVPASVVHPMAALSALVHGSCEALARVQSVEELGASAVVPSLVLEGGFGRTLVVAESMPDDESMGSDARLLALIASLGAMARGAPPAATHVLVRVLTADSPYTSAAVAALGVSQSIASRRGGLSSIDRLALPFKTDAAAAPMSRSERARALDDLALERQAAARGPLDMAIIPLWFWNLCSLPEEFIPQLRASTPGTAIVVMTDDVHARRRAMLAVAREAEGDALAAVRAQVGLPAQATLDDEIWQRELAIYAAADAVAAVTKADAALLDELLASSGVTTPVHVLPFTAWRCPEDEPQAPRGARSGLLFVGGSANDGNVAALEWLVDAVVPYLAARRDAVLSVVGAIDSETMSRLLERVPVGRVVFLGPLPGWHLEQVLARVAVFVSPVVTSSGISTKNVMAMQRGVPLVTTPWGAAGLGPDPPVLVAETASMFVGAILDLLSDEALWSGLSLASVEHVRSALGPDKAFDALVELMMSIRINRERHIPSDLPATSVCDSEGNLCSSATVMAEFVTWIWESVSSALVFLGLSRSRERKVVFVGLDAAGKTSLMEVLTTGRLSTHQPTIQPSSHEVTLGALTLRAVDVGGHKQARRVWGEYFFGVDGVVFLVDAADASRFEEASTELLGVLDNEHLADAPVVVLANKVDEAWAAGPEDMAVALGISAMLTGADDEQLGDSVRPLHIFPCSLKLRQGYGAGLNWLAAHMSK